MKTPCYVREWFKPAVFAALMVPSIGMAGITPGSKNIGAVWFIGDSITQSNADGDSSGSPRKSLYNLLVANGYTFTFTGHYTANIDGLPATGGTADTNLYQYHSGISGSVIGDNYSGRTGMTQNTPTFWTTGRLATVKPNVILIMLGTNDVDQNIDLANAPARLTTLVNTIYAQPGVGSPTVMVASIPPNRTTLPADPANTATYNAAVPGVVTAQQALGRDVHFVDQFTPLDSAYATTMMGDNLHTNTAGNNSLALQWFNKINAIVSSVSGKDILTFVFPGLPAATITGTNINVDVPYRTNVTALAPTFTLSAGATAAPVSGTVRNFTTPQTYTVTALDFSTKVYTVSVTPVNHAPVAAPQNVSTTQNTARAILLAASDEDGDDLTYVTVVPPAHGTLSGNAPNMTYTPGAGYLGADSFTFKANDGILDSAVATVSLTILPVVFTWKSGVAGNWSDSAKWTYGSPAAAGNEAYVLNFNVGGTYTSTNNLGAGFLLNQLNFGGSTATLAGNSLEFAAAGSALPQLNQNSSLTVAVNNNLILPANTTVGGSGTGATTLAGAISGVGGLTKTASSQLILSGTNTYNGPTILSDGILRLTKSAALYNAVEANWTPANLSVSPGATLRLHVGGAGDFTPAQVARLIENLATVNHNGLMDGAYIGLDTYNATLLTTTIAANITDSGGPGGGAVGLRKYSIGTVLLAGSNTYSGKTIIDSGTLSVASINSVNGGSPPLANSSLGRPVTAASGSIDFGNISSFLPATLLYTGTGETTDRVMNFAGLTATYTFDQSGTGLLKFTSPFTITGSNYNKTIMLKGATAGAGEIAGAISDPSPGKTTSLTKSGTGIWKLSGLNSFSGATKVQAGTLVCTSASSPGTGTMDITTGAKLQLDYIGTRQVAALTFNLGSAQPNGTYGSTASSATNKNDTCFSGTGTLTVGPVTTIQYVLTVVAAPSHGGMVAGGGTCDQGTLRAITATPNSGWQFAGWIGKGVTAPGAATTTVLMNGGKSLTANFTALDSYASWAGDPAQGLTAGVNDGPNDDPDLDGIPNLLECALAGPPMVASRAILPVLAKQPGTWTFEYDRSVLSRPPATTQIVEYGSDLTGWTQVTIPAESNGIVTVTPGTTLDRVKVTLPTPGARCFARLKLVQPQD